MITLQAEFDNKNRALWPGQFVDASVVLTKIPNTIMVPSDALLVTQDGVSAFVAKDDGTVEIRPVEVGRKIKNMIVVEKGLTAGEKVVDSAQIKLVPGARIKIVSNEQYKAGPTSPKSGEQGAQGAQETGGSDKKSTEKQGQGS
jgi:membrane fusion protein, multidrug efflux system